jgi:hypothetical protein
MLLTDKILTRHPAFLTWGVLLISPFCFNKGFWEDSILLVNNLGE